MKDKKLFRIATDYKPELVKLEATQPGYFNTSYLLQVISAVYSSHGSQCAILHIGRPDDDRRHGSAARKWTGMSRAASSYSRAARKLGNDTAHWTGISREHWTGMSRSVQPTTVLRTSDAASEGNSDNAELRIPGCVTSARGHAGEESLTNGS